MGLYVAILAIIILGFSLFLYQSVKLNISDPADGEFVGEQSQTIFVDRALHSIQRDIFLVDLTILLLAAGACYMLAGYTLRPIQRALKAQKQFSENASHELRTPLAVMKNDTEVLLRNSFPTKESIRTTLQSNIEEIDRMSKMVKDLLAIARSENQVFTSGEKLDVTTNIRMIVQKLTSLATGKGVRVVFPPGDRLFVQGNTDAFERIFMNLLQNALHYTPQGGTIAINTWSEGTQVFVEISDTGTGITADDLPHVFERFYKGEGSQGSGLGLSLVQELVKQSGGSVNILSAKNKGTTVTVTFPELS